MLSIKDFPGVACKVKATPAGSYHSALDSAALVRSLNCSLNIKTCAHIIVCVVLLFLLQPNVIFYKECHNWWPLIFLVEYHDFIFSLFFFFLQPTYDNNRLSPGCVPACKAGCQLGGSLSEHRFGVCSFNSAGHFCWKISLKINLTALPSSEIVCGSDCMCVWCVCVCACPASVQVSLNSSLVMSVQFNFVLAFMTHWTHMHHHTSTIT